MEELPKCPLPLKGFKGGDDMVGWDSWARNQLMAAGSDLLGKLSNLQVLLLLSHLFSYFSYLFFAFWLGKFRPENAHNLIYQNCFIVSFVMIYYIGKIISLNGARDSWV